MTTVWLNIIPEHTHTHTQQHTHKYARVYTHVYLTIYGNKQSTQK